MALFAARPASGETDSMASTTTYLARTPDSETRRDFLNLVVVAFTGFGVIAVT